MNDHLRGEDHFVATAFDAYYTWLGIPPEEQPPNLYRLLGIKLFEGNRDVIQHAADRQMAHLKSFNNSQNAAHAQRLLNELSSAAGILMNAEKKQAYDQQLKGGSAATATPHRPPPFSQREGTTIELPRFSVADPLVTPLSVLVTESLPAPRRRRSASRAGGPPPWIGLAVVGALLLVILVVGLALSSISSDGQQPANADAPVTSDRG